MIFTQLAVLIHHRHRTSGELIGSDQLQASQCLTGIQLERLFELANRFSHSPQRHQADPHQKTRSRVIGLQAHGLTKLAQSALMGALSLIDNAEVIVQKSSLAPLAKDFQESTLSFLQLAS